MMPLMNVRYGTKLMNSSQTINRKCYDIKYLKWSTTFKDRGMWSSSFLDTTCFWSQGMPSVQLQINHSSFTEKTWNLSSRFTLKFHVFSVNDRCFICNCTASYQLLLQTSEILINKWGEKEDLKKETILIESLCQIESLYWKLNCTELYWKCCYFKLQTHGSNYDTTKENWRVLTLGTCEVSWKDIAWCQNWNNYCCS